ncbi:MAG TPA: hypothetical protein VKL61_10375 [Candidatus Polarisedimenticolia bacterium]|nr:hypothetical protein [Candidatus Polarisedimenticolia bacterium]
MTLAFTLSPPPRTRRWTAGVLLTAIVFLVGASDRLHNHSGAEPGVQLLAPWTSGRPVLATAQPVRFTGSVPCLACLHNRTFSVGPTDTAPSGHQEAHVSEPCPALPTPPPAPTTRPVLLRAPPLA